MQIISGWLVLAGVCRFLAGCVDAAPAAFPAPPALRMRWRTGPTGPVFRLSRCITTLPSNLTTSPPPVILSRSEETVPLVNLTSTCSSDATSPLSMSTAAWLSQAS